MRPIRTAATLALGAALATARGRAGLRTIVQLAAKRVRREPEWHAVPPPPGER